MKNAIGYTLHRLARLLLLMAIVYSLPLRSQQSAFVAKQQRMAVLPGEVRNVSVVDGALYCYASGVMLKVQRSGEQLMGFWADTSLSKYGENVDYVVRQPGTGDLYFTCTDKNGDSYLYCSSQNRKARQVRLGGGLFFNKGMTVEHPTFTEDGRIMIFCSLDRHRSFGGYDLWYTVFDGKQWEKPRNLGNRINTDSDEISPWVYRDCLLFASNGRKGDDGNLGIYATRLISDRVEGDTVGMFQIGRCKVQRLPAPLNADDADDFDMVFDSLTGCGYWVSHRTETSGDSQLYSFEGALDGVLLWGLVMDKLDNPLPGVQIFVRQGDQVVCSSETDEDGFYHLYLQGDQYYDISYRLDDYFSGYESINTTKEVGEYLIAEARRDLKLEKLPLGERLYYEDLFGPDVDIELSELGRERLEPLVRFLNDNPEMSVDMSLSNDLTTNSRFNTLLTDQRLLTLRNYLFQMVPPTVVIHIHNSCAGIEGCSNASGLSRLIVQINKGEK